MPIPNGAHGVRYDIAVRQDSPAVEYDLAVEFPTSYEPLNAAAEQAMTVLVTELEDAYPQGRVIASRTYSTTSTGDPWPPAS